MVLCIKEIQFQSGNGTVKSMKAQKLLHLKRNLNNRTRALLQGLHLPRICFANLVESSRLRRPGCQLRDRSDAVLNASGSSSGGGGGGGGRLRDLKEVLELILARVLKAKYRN